MYIIWGRANRVGVYCDKCGHFHDMDVRGLPQANKSSNKSKPKSAKIRDYGNYHF